MAYGFGTTVNPQLGAVDYSNYLRGALSGAQMQAQGGAAIGAGVQNALAGIGEGIQKYQQNKILQSEIMGGVEENINFLVNNNPESIQNAPKAVQDVLRRMEDAKGVSLKDSAYLKSWLDSATKQAKDNIENNALVSALGPNSDGTPTTGQQAAIKYFASGGQNQSLIGTLIAFGNNPLEVDLLNARIKGQDLSNAGAKQVIEGNVPLTAYQQEQLEIQKDNARREEERLRLDQNQDTRAEKQAAASAEAAKNAERRAEESIRFASAANNRAEKQAAASAEAAIERSRVDQLANEGISIFNKGEDGFNKFLETLSPQDQGIVLTEVKQFRDKTPAESKLTAGAIADIMMKRDGNKGPTFGEYLNELRKAQASGKIEERTGNKYVVKGWRNDIDKIPAFEELIRQFPQFKVLPDEGQETIELPNGGFISPTSPQ
jgi:predicted XRE-type DNA-binding protein